MINQRDLLLVPFPFSDQLGRKVRPVVVISNNEFNQHSEDILVVGITSNITKDKYAIKLDNASLEEGRLSTQCSIKSENILKIEKELIVKKIGKINAKTLDNLIERILEIIKN